MSAREMQPKLEEVLSPEQIITAAELCSACEVDGRLPTAVVRPENVAQVGKLLALCAREGWAVIPWGSGVHIRLGNVPRKYDIGLDMGGLNQIVEYDADNLTLTAGAGCTLKELEDLLAERGQFLPLDPPMSDRATLGGVIASNAFGPSRLRYGAARDITLGLQVALTTGEIIEVGGKTVKNVAGYDLTKLFVGSFGSLGVITQATCRLLPLPEQERVFVAGFQTLDDVMGVVERALNSKLLPTYMDVLRGPVTPDMSAAMISLVVGLDGAKEIVERQARDFRRLAVEGRAIHTELLESSSEVPRVIRDLPNTARPPLVMRASLPISAVKRFWSAIEHLEAEQTATLQLLARPGLGTVYVMFDAEKDVLGTVAETVQQLAAGLNGHAIVERIPAEVKRELDVWGPARDGWPLMQALKSRFDPDGIMSPGRFVGRL